jgi:hypothetical protein
VDRAVARTLECTLSPEQKRLALEQVLQGNTFSRADQLKRFLRYVCEMEIAGRAETIKEYSIATEALGHSAAYSSSEASSVRSRAYSLRQKLQEYYEIEHPDAEIQISLQKGSYVPCFVRRPEVLTRLEAVERPEAVEQVGAGISSPDKTRRNLAFAFCAGALVVLALGVVALFVVNVGKADSVEPALRETWGPMLRPGAEVVVCIGSPPSLLLKSWKIDPTPFNKDVTPAPEGIVNWYSGLRMMDGGGKLYMGNSLNTLLAGDALAAMRAVRVLTSAGASIQVLPEAGLRPLVLRGRNVLLIGSPNYSPYAARVLRSSPFSIYFDTASREEVIADNRPETGPKQIFRPKRDEFGQTTMSYGLLTVIRSGTENGRNEQTVIFSGIGSAGSQAAMEFFASAPDLKEFRERLKREGKERMPDSFQVIVRCGVDRLLALDWHYETHRLISHPPALE